MELNVKSDYFIHFDYLFVIESINTWKKCQFSLMFLRILFICKYISVNKRIGVIIFVCVQ